MTKRIKVDNKDGLKYERTNHKKRTVATKRTWPKPGAILSLHAKAIRKAPDMVKLRFLKRLDKIENILNAPFLYEEHGLEEYIRMIVRDEMGIKIKQKPNKPKPSKTTILRKSMLVAGYLEQKKGKKK